MKKLFKKRKSNKIDTNIAATLPQPKLEFLKEIDLDGLSLSSQALSDVPSEVIINTRIQYGTRWSAFKGILLEYSQNTSIHGIRYIFALHRPLYEKLYWLILTAISCYFAVSVIWATYLKWQDTPVILGFDETLVPVHKIPFPTVTICPEIKVERTQFDFTNISQQISDEIHQFKAFKNKANLPEEDLDRFTAMLHMCDADVTQYFLNFIQENPKMALAETLIGMSVSKNETGPACKWNGHFYLCENIFNYVATDEGICYQFNALQSKDIYRNESFLSYYDTAIPDYNKFFGMITPFKPVTGKWSLDEGYKGQGFHSYPQRTIFSTARNGFFAFLQGYEHNLDYTCRQSQQGYKVFLNSPESVPVTTGNYFLVPHNDEVLVSVIPQYVISTENLHSFKPDKRQCYFNDERYLRYFRHYSQNNCQTECLTNYTIAKCGCAKFWMPKPFDVRVCGLADIKCYTSAQSELSIILQNQTLLSTVNANVKVMCDCMPSCISLSYDFEISRARYDLYKTIRALREVYEHSDSLGARLAVFFKENQFTAIKRTVLFSTSTLIANFGGILGLLMGISSLTLFEFIYFFTVRLMDTLYKRRETKMKLIKENEDKLKSELSTDETIKF